MEGSIVIRVRATIRGRYLEAVEATVRPELVRPGDFLRLILPPGPAGPRVILVFNNRQERDASLDRIEEEIFEVNHPVRPPTP